MFAHGPADATAIPIPHLLLPHLNPDWFYLSGTGLPSLSWKRGRLSDVVVVVVSQQVVTGILPLVDCIDKLFSGLMRPWRLASSRLAGCAQLAEDVNCC